MPAGLYIYARDLTFKARSPRVSLTLAGPRASPASTQGLKQARARVFVRRSCLSICLLLNFFRETEYHPTLVWTTMTGSLPLCLSLSLPSLSRCAPRHVPDARHLLCVCVHHQLQEIVVSVAGGSLIRLQLQCHVEYHGLGLWLDRSCIHVCLERLTCRELRAHDAFGCVLSHSYACLHTGKGLGSGKTVKVQRVIILNRWPVIFSLSSPPPAPAVPQIPATAEDVEERGSAGMGNRNSNHFGTGGAGAGGFGSDGEAAWVWSLHADEVSDRVIGACGKDVYLWKWMTGAVDTVIQRAHDELVTACILIPTTPCLLVTASRDTTLKVWKLSGSVGLLLDTLCGHLHGVYDVQYERTSNLLYSFGDDGRIICWSMRTLAFVNAHRVTKPSVFVRKLLFAHRYCRFAVSAPCGYACLHMWTCMLVYSCASMRMDMHACTCVYTCAHACTCSCIQRLMPIQHATPPNHATWSRSQGLA